MIHTVGPPRPGQQVIYRRRGRGPLGPARRTIPDELTAQERRAGGALAAWIRPDRLLVEVAGAGAEFGCLEPYPHWR